MVPKNVEKEVKILELSTEQNTIQHSSITSNFQKKLQTQRLVVDRRVHSQLEAMVMSSLTSTKIGLVEQNAVQSHGRLLTPSIPGMITRGVSVTNSEVVLAHVPRAKKSILEMISVMMVQVQSQTLNQIAILIQTLKVARNHQLHAVRIPINNIAKINLIQNQSMFLIPKKSSKRSGIRSTTLKSRNPEQCSRLIALWITSRKRWQSFMQFLNSKDFYKTEFVLG
jgi:hypothetical protein